MGKTLSAAKPKFQKDLYDAISNAYKAQFSTDGCGEYTSDVNDAMNEAAHNFADSLSKNLSEIIYNYIMEMQITITHTLISGTVLTPVMGTPTPATGAISILPTEVKIS